jgi:hypothetical protein
MPDRNRRFGRRQVAVIVLVVLVALALVVPLVLGPPPAPGPGSRAPGDPSATRALMTPTPREPAASPDVAGEGPPAAYLIVDRADLLARPTDGPAWDALVEAAMGEWDRPDLQARESNAPVRAIAAAILHARTGDEEARERVEAALRELHEAPWTGDMLSLARQLGGWVIAADLIGYREPAFLEWLHHARLRTTGGHFRWRTLYGTAGETANNYGTFALASLIAADRFLGDEVGLERSWRIFSGYGIPFGYPFEKTADWSVEYSCVGSDPERPDLLPIAINPPDCTRWGGEIVGMPVEDAARAQDFPRPHAGYVNEAMQGYVLQALLLARAGYDAWEVNDQQVRRVADYQVRWRIWNTHPTGYYAAWLVNHAYGTDYAAKSPTSGGRIFGWTDWLYS